MRIKLFENFKDKDIKPGIQDILVELKDIGFNTRIIELDKAMSINIIKPNSEFEYQEIEDYVIMVTDYINNYLPNSQIKYLGYDQDLFKNLDTTKFDNPLKEIPNRVYWDELENKSYKFRTFKICVNMNDREHIPLLSNNYL